MLGHVIRSVRLRRQLTQADVAAISGIAQANLSAIERERRVPSVATLAQLLAACGAELLVQVGDATIPIGLDDADLDGGDLAGTPTAPWSDEERGRMLVAALEVSEVIARSR